MSKELEYIKQRVDYLYQETKDYIESKGLLDFLGEIFSEGISSTNTASNSSIEFHIENQVGDYLREQANDRAKEAIVRRETGRIGGQLRRPAGIPTPDGVFSISITPRFDGSVSLVNNSQQIYSYEVVVTIRYDVTIIGSTESINGSFSLPTIRGSHEAY